MQKEISTNSDGNYMCSHSFFNENYDFYQSRNKKKKEQEQEQERRTCSNLYLIVPEEKRIFCMQEMYTVYRKYELTS